MTLRYASSIPGQGNYLKFFKLLIHWRGSIYKLVWFDLSMYLLIYYSVSITYRFILPVVDEGRRARNETQLAQHRFEEFVLYVGAMKSKAISVTFLLGFFVSQVLSRWWRMFANIPMMNTPAFNLNSLIMTTNNPDVARRIRLTAMRYLNLAWILSLRRLSTLIRRRFDVERVEQYVGFHRDRVAAELDVFNKDALLKKHFPVMVTKSEIQAFQDICSLSEDPDEYVLDWCVPLQWCLRLMKKAVKHGYIENERNYLALVGMVDGFQRQLYQLSIYSKFNLPLVYSQVVIIAVYTFLLMSVFDNQFVKKQHVRDRDYGQQYLFDYYVPVFGILEFLFVVGWMKVALVLLNPLGSDDEDFPTCDILDFNVKLSRFVAGNYRVVFPKKLQEQVDVTAQDLNLSTAIEYLDSEDEDSHGRAVPHEETLYKRNSFVISDNSIRHADSHDII